ncbi:hypothetical protein [Actinomycetospora sp. TBRC 11914]|uniref:hypothetical protein n=1 Tax=Actinomycetospora sp. TBRC 11914 TaxID=2729387 RepID=UPI00145C9444|nr:hypothetical protein [Actinomycetospora sp. TBRC 11914]NMO90592.1 hypothetical protein [Actinomycetospora sp. TBRC 11914]
MRADRSTALALWCAQVRAQAEASRTLLVHARRRAHDQERYARAACARTQEQADRNINGWAAGRGLASSGEGRTRADVVGVVLDAVGPLYGGCLSISLTLVEQLGGDRPQYRTAGPTGVADAMDAAQYRLAEGPCVEAVELDMVAVVRADDLAGSTDRRAWPDLCREADELGVRSALSIAVPWTPQRVGVDAEQWSLGAINCYASEPHAFTQTEAYGRLVGCWAGALMSGQAPADLSHAGE